MIPLVTNAVPENGAENVALEKVITITFQDEIDPYSLPGSSNSSNIELMNYNTNERVDVNIEVVGGTSVSIAPLSPLSYSSEYRVYVSGLSSIYGEMMSGTYELRFYTEDGLIEDVIGDVDFSQIFEVVMTHPKDSTVITPEEIKIKVNKTIKSDSSKSEILLFEDAVGTTINEALFSATSLLVDDDIEFSSLNDEGLISIKVPTLQPGTKYSLIISGIQSDTVDRQEILPYMFSFTSEYLPSYAKIESIIATKSITTLLKGSSSENIAYLICENSKMAEFIANQAGNYENVKWSMPDYFVEKYVITKTQYDIVFDKFIQLSSGPTEKQLKDLAVTYGFSLSDMLKMADRLKSEYKIWEGYLMGKGENQKASAGTFKRGENADVVPDYKDRSLKSVDGSKSW